MRGNLVANNICIEMVSYMLGKVRYASLDEFVAYFREPSDGNFVSTFRAAGVPSHYLVRLSMVGLT